MTDASLFFEFCGMCDRGNEAQWCFQFITMAIASALQMAETNIAFVSVCVGVDSVVVQLGWEACTCICCWRF